MANDLAIATGSIADVARQRGISLPEALLDCRCLAIIDVSSSMSIDDSRGNRTRYDVAVEELAIIQKKYAGQVAVIAFSDKAIFYPGGVPALLGGGTDLAEALRVASTFDHVPFIVISDGEPDDANAALAIAATIKSPISTIYVGPETRSHGRAFLSRLASQHRGQAYTAARAIALADKVQLLLEGGM